MAQKYIVELVDDLDGSTAEETITFGLDGKQYVIDLSNDNASTLRAALNPFVSAGRRENPKTKPILQVAGKRGDLADIRAWANSHGYTVAERGRIQSSVVEAYDAAG